MATDATGPVTSPDNIPTYNTSADAPSGKGLNAIVAAIQAALSALRPSSLIGYPADATKFLRGDGTWAAPAPGAMVQLYDNVAGSSIASWDVSGISQAYSHLRIVVQARCDAAVVATTLAVRLNGDSTANYDWFETRALNTGAIGQNGVGGGTSIQLSDYMPGASATPTRACVSDGIFANYTSTTFMKVYTGTYYSYTSADLVSGSVGGDYRTLSGINRVQVFAAAGNISAGSRLSIYGIL